MLIVFLSSFALLSGALAEICHPCVAYGDHEPRCSNDGNKLGMVVNVTDTALSGFIQALSVLNGEKSDTRIYVPQQWLHNAWVRFILSANRLQALGVNSSSHCIRGPVSILQLPPIRSPGSIGFPLRSAYERACGLEGTDLAPPPRDPSDVPALLLDQTHVSSGFPGVSTELERFLMRQGLAYRYMKAPGHLCDLIKLIRQNPWRAVFTVDGPHLLHMVNLPLTTPLVAVLEGMDHAALFCAVGESLHSKRYAYVVKEKRLVDCAKDKDAAAEPSHPAVIEPSLSCFNSDTKHCRDLFPHTLAAYPPASFPLIRDAIPGALTNREHFSPVAWSSFFFTHIWPRALGKTLANIVMFLGSRSPKPKPKWPKLWDPATCSVDPTSAGNGREEGKDQGAAKEASLASAFPYTSTKLELIPTPYDTEVWQTYGDPDKPPPKLYVVTYNTAVNKASSCLSLESAHAQGYEVNLLGYWRLKAFDYMKMAPGFKEDKAWFIMMLTRELTENKAGDDLVFMYDGTDVVFQLPPSVLVQRYLQQGTEMLVSAEAGCWPNEVPQQCTDFTEKHIPKYLRVSGLPFIYPNTGAIIAPAHFWANVFLTCYHNKVEADHRGETVPYYIFKDSDQKFFYHILMGCPLETSTRAHIQLDYYQDLFGSVATEHWYSYDWDGRQALWSLRPRVFGTSTRAREKDKESAVDRAPVLLHFPGKGKLNYYGWNRMVTTLMRAFSGVGGTKDPLRSFQCGTLMLVDFRKAFFGEVCSSASEP